MPIKVLHSLKSRRSLLKAPVGIFYDSMVSTPRLRQPVPGIALGLAAATFEA